MAHYKDKSNKLYFLDDNIFSYLLPTDCIVITDEEADTIRLSQAVVETIEDKRSRMILTAAEARLKLKSAGKLTTVNAAINTLSEDDDMRILWEYSTELHRLNPFLIQFCKSTLNMDDAQIDALFTLALTFEE